MKFYLFLLFFFAELTCANANPTTSNIHALLVSSISCEDISCSISYAVEAEVAHAYHLLRANGVPANQIIVAHRDAVTNNIDYNPKPGTLCTDKNLTINYREGLQIDYTGDDVTVANVLAVLQGDKEKVRGGNGRVLESGPNDHIFVYHSGHGEINHLIYHNETMTSKELNDALKKMQEKKMYKELVFYLSACRSESMFDRGQLSDKEKIYVVTASEREEDAWGKDSINYNNPKGEKIEIFVNTEFGIGWLTDTETHDTLIETLNEQYSNLRHVMKKSTPVELGDLEITKETLSTFEGHSSQIKHNLPNSENAFQLPISRYSAYLVLKRKLQNTKNSNERMSLKMKLQKMETEQRKLKEMADRIIHVTMPGIPVKQFKLKEIVTKEPKYANSQHCNHLVIKQVEKKCNFVLKSPFSSELMFSLSKLCDLGANPEIIMQQLEIRCENF